MTSAGGADVLAVDLGGTHVRAALVGADGSILTRDRADTPTDEPEPDGVVAFMRDVLGRGSAARAVMGVPGRVDYRAGTLPFAPNIPQSWLPHLTAERLSADVGIPVALANDADLAAVGESYFGAGAAFDDIVYVTVSTGVGAGVVVSGHLLHGRLSLAEIGHTVIDRDAAARGEPATVEQLGSGTALGRMASAAGVAGDGEQVVELVRSGDPAAVEVWDRMAGAVAVAAGNLAHLFSPDVIVVGGGVGLVGDLLLEPVREWLRGPFGPTGLQTPIEVRSAALGDDAGLVGAAGWARAFGPGRAGRDG